MNSSARIFRSLGSDRATAQSLGTTLLFAQNVHRYLGTGEARTLILRGVNLTIRRIDLFLADAGVARITMLK